MNQYNYDNERGLIVTHAPSKSLDDVKRVITSGRPQKGIDAAIAAYIPTLDPTQPIIDAWYEQQLLVESLDADEVVTRTYRDENGDEQTETLDNPYTVALNARTDLEDANTWLKGYRGLLSVPERPEFTMTVEDFKADNVSLFQARNKVDRTNELNSSTVELDGMVFDADNDARFNVMFALSVAEASGQTSTLWKLHDNSWQVVTKVQLSQVLVLIGLKLQEVMEKYG